MNPSSSECYIQIDLLQLIENFLSAFNKYKMPEHILDNLKRNTFQYVFMEQQASSIQFKSQYFKNRNIGISLRKDSVDKSGEILGIYIFQTVFFLFEKKSFDYSIEKSM